MKNLQCKDKKKVEGSKKKESGARFMATINASVFLFRFW
jgi:hypothetical protein